MNVEEFSLALDEPLVTATTTVRERSGFLVRCDHRGQGGVGEATPLPSWTEGYDDCQSALETATAVAETQDAQAALREIPRSARAARHGLSTAILDADAKANDVPLSEWLACSEPAQRVPVNATLGDHDPVETAERARATVDEGFETCKLKVGARSLGEDLDRTAAVREAVGNDVTLRVDANGNWSRDVAERAIEELAAYDVSLVEQPLPAEDLAGLAALRGGPLEVAVDETLATVSPAAVADAGAADVLVLKPMVLGGPGEAHTIATWARERGLDVVVTTTIDAVVARTAAVHVAAAIPDVRACGLATGSLLAADLGPDPATIEDGHAQIPDAPGLGLDEVSVDG